jgi:hypothetical protein
VGTVMQYKAQGNEDRHQRWARIECATLGERYDDLQAQGLSQRQAAKMLDVPRSTLQAWRAYHERLDESPVIVAFFRSVAGLAFLHRLVVALHLVYTEVGACGIRLVCLFLQMTGLHRFVGASDGTPHQGNRRGEEAIGASRQEESARLACARPATDIPMAQEETCTGGRCLGGRDPVSHAMVFEQAALARAPDPGHALMDHALAGRHGQGMQSTSEEAPGLHA